MLLEFSQYLENSLWPNYHPRLATHAHLMSIVVTVNEKVRERVPAWHVSRVLLRKRGESGLGTVMSSGGCLVRGSTAPAFSRDLEFS